ncbi:NAD(P)-dependent oxidoreductase [Celeribacter arenosi]|uniref:NAD(P)-binding domain-containing protein n=1 Tax=Celeribacter arenosi TaxID=792649 RepID=A0ABP7KBI2_9RHOB
MKRICIIGISGKLGLYMAKHALAQGYEVTGLCRAQSAHKLDHLKGAIILFTGNTDDPDAVARAVAGCDGVLCVLVPWGVEGYATKTAQAVLDTADPDARLVFSCGWHISRDGKDRYPLKLRVFVALFGKLALWARFADLRDQVEATRRIFASNRRWTVVRGSNLEEGESEGLPIWARHVGDPVLASNLTRRTDFALFMVHALSDDRLIQEAPAIVGRNAASVRSNPERALVPQ